MGYRIRYYTPEKQNLLNSSFDNFYHTKICIIKIIYIYPTFI
ncbi:MAG: hypothetical protein RL432_1888 [Bacteroidota bacterium]|jgi:hypothetical protein